jgi:lipopolysaccharide/colanic/teichoic acid biosynthesis glycosyltransferase
MVKFRTMIVGADRSGVDSTAGDDPRITHLGARLRAWKIDELPQLWNVLTGQMSLVGPRPNVPRETVSYTADERLLLTVRPGVTDLASIVFADEADILHGSQDANLTYNQIIRPWKSRLGLLYVTSRKSLWRDLRIMALTALGIVARRRALSRAARLVRELGGDIELVQVSKRGEPLRAAPPPGATQIVQQRTFQPAR